MVAFQTTQLEIQKPQEVERLKPSMIIPQHPLLARLIRHQYSTCIGACCQHSHSAIFGWTSQNYEAKSLLLAE